MPAAKTVPPKRSSMDQIGVRIPPPLLEQIDALVTERNNAAGWIEVNRSDIVRELVIAGLASRGRAIGAAKVGTAPTRSVEYDEPPPKRAR